MARSIIFVNDSGTPWVLNDFGGIIVPAAGTYDVTDLVSDDEIVSAIQKGLGAEFDADRYIRKNGVDQTADESANYGNQADPVAAIGIATPLVDGIVAANDKWALVNNIATGLCGGAILSINGGDATKFDIAEGFGAIVDFTDPNVPTYLRRHVAAKTGIAAIGIGVSNVTYVAVDSSDTVVQKTTPFTFDELRDSLYLGILIHPLPSPAITGTTMLPRTTFGNDSNVQDFFDALGPFNVQGNVVGNNGANLQLSKSSGQCFMQGANYENDRTRPSVVNNPALAPEFFQYAYRDGVGGWVTTALTNVVDPNNYDDGSGTLQAVPAGKWACHYVFMFPAQSILGIQYAQGYYDTLEDAQASVPSEIFVDADKLILRARLIVQQGATDLSNPAQAKFITVSKFGLVDIIAGATSGESNTASNVGSTGTGLFKQKAGVDLEFHKLSSASAAIAVAYDAGTDTVRLTFALPTHASTHATGGSDPITPASIDAEPEFSKNTAFNKDFGSASGEVCEGNDARLSDARTPTAHAPTHEGGSDPISPAGIGAEAAFAKNTAFNKNFGSGAGDVCQGNDARLSDARTPTAHAPTHEGGSDPISPAGIGAEPTISPKNTAFNKNFGSSAGTVCEGNDARLSDARTPTAHGTTHNPGAGDAATTAAPGATGVGTTPGEGTAASFARSDHRHQSNTAPVNVTKAAAVIGTSGEPARADHKHDVTTGVASGITDSTNAEGTGTSLARSDHTHAHGNRGGGALHAAATPSVNGFMSSTDKTKLDACGTPQQSSATANATTTSGTDVLIAGMTLTPGAGNYILNFSTSLNINSNSQTAYISVYVNGVKVGHTERGYATPAFVGVGMIVPISVCAYLTGVGAGQAVEIRWRVTGGATVTALQRTLVLQKVM